MAGSITDIHPNIMEKYFNYYVGITTEQVAEICNIHIKTARRHQKNNTWPLWMRRLVMMYGGFIAQPGWENWKIHPADNKLYCPTLKYGFTPSDIQSIHFMRQQVRTLELQTPGLS